MNDKTAEEKTIVRSFNLWLIVAVIVFLFGGIALTVWTAQNEESQIRERLLIQNRLVVRGIDYMQVNGLTGSESDLSSPEYLALKKRLVQVRSADPEIRFIYLMRQRPDGAIIILVDSEPPESVDYSPPGQEYHEASVKLRNVFVSKAEITEGPSADRWGTWVSSITPVIDPATGNVVAVMGMDIDAHNWNMRIIVTCLPVATGILILLFILLVFLYVHQRNEQEKQILEKSERILREAKNQLNDIINFLPDATFVIDSQRRVITWNKAIEEMTGILAGDILGKGDYEYALPFYGTRRPILIDMVMAPESDIADNYNGDIHHQENLLTVETELPRPDGSVVYFAARASPICDEQGTVIGAIESIRNITKRKMAENRLKLSEERLRLLLQNINDGIIVHEVSSEGPGKILEVNDRICDMTGYTRDEFLHMSIQDLDVPEQQANVSRISDNIFSKMYSLFETECIRKDGQRVPVEISARLFDLQGKPTVLAVVRDITERKILEKEMELYSAELTRFAETLRQTNDKLNLMNSITRHDILNQLTLILGYLELTKEQFHDPKLQEYLGAEIRSARNIQNQIMFTKEYQDIGSQAPKWFNLNNTILSAAAGLSLSPVTVSLPVDAFEIYADPLLEKVFYTLLENAIRHGKKVTEIVFSCREQETGLMILCQDNGEGIPAGVIEDIFQQKYFQHTGYGLFLSRAILNITGISIKETGEPGKGARFEILVPRGAYRVAGTPS